jgi:S-formylglutathione hydrolase FrmB
MRLADSTPWGCSNRMFNHRYRNVRGHDGQFDFPSSGDHGWSSWGSQLAAMSGDLVAAIK